MRYQTKPVNTHTWALIENGYTHTAQLTEQQASEMHERYSRIFPENEYYLLDMAQWGG